MRRRERGPLTPHSSRLGAPPRDVALFMRTPSSKLATCAARAPSGASRRRRLCERKRCAARRARTGAPTPAAQKRAPSRAREGAETASLGCHSQRKVTDHSGQHASRQGLFLSQAGVAAPFLARCQRAACGRQRAAQGSSSETHAPLPQATHVLSRAARCMWRAQVTGGEPPGPAGQHQVFMTWWRTQQAVKQRRGGAAMRPPTQITRRHVFPTTPSLSPPPLLIPQPRSLPRSRAPPPQEGQGPPLHNPRETTNQGRPVCRLLHTP